MAERSAWSFIFSSVAPVAASMAAAAPPQPQTRSALVATQNEGRQGMTDSHRYAGMWMTDDGDIRHQLLPGGRYDEARGTRESAYRGRYTITGDHIDYVDDTGFTADGDFVDDVLYHAGMILRRVPAETQS